MIEYAPKFTEDVFSHLFPLFSEFPHMKTPHLDVEFLSVWSIILPKEKIVYYIENEHDNMKESEHPFAGSKRDWKIYRIDNRITRNFEAKDIAFQIKEHALFQKKIKKQRGFSPSLFSRIFL